MPITFTTSDWFASSTSTSRTDPGTLRFDQSNSASYSGVLSGNGFLEKGGSGILTLAANSSIGGTTVDGGELALASGVSLGGPIDVQGGGRLGGTGTASGNVTVTGTLAPGTTSAPDILSVGGNLDLQPGSVLEVDVNDANQSDRVNVTATATLQAGSLVTLIPASGDTR